MLDNCEHLLEACAELVERLLACCPDLRVLATSREPLGVGGEADYPVPPLALPRRGCEPDELRRSEAVRLFLARARAGSAAARRRRPTTLADARRASAATSTGCRSRSSWRRPGPRRSRSTRSRAASRPLPLPGLVAPAARRPATARSGRRWTGATSSSSTDEQRLLAGLSVFAGGFTLDAAAAVCLDGDDARALELVERLVDASLVVAEERDGEMRYRLLETVRQYAAERLAEAGDAGARATSARGVVPGARRGGRAGADRREADNLVRPSSRPSKTTSARRCPTWHGAREPELRLRLTIALTRFWYVRGYLAEGRGAGSSGARRRPARPGPAPEAARADGGAVARAAPGRLRSGHLASRRKASTVARETGEPRFVANALSNLGAIVLAAGDTERAEPLLEEAVALAREVGDERIAALAINNLGDLALTVGDYERARAALRGEPGACYARAGTRPTSRARSSTSAPSRWSSAGSMSRESRFARASLPAREAGDKEDLAWCLEGFARWRRPRTSGERAAQLLGAADALLDRDGRRLQAVRAASARGDRGARARALRSRSLRDGDGTRNAGELDDVLDGALSHAAA